MKNAIGKVVTQEVRLSYLNVYEAKAYEPGDTPKFSTAILIDKSDETTIKAINKAIKAVIEANKESKFGGKTKGLKTPLRDGDSEEEDKEGEEYRGVMFLNASSTKRPVLLDENSLPIMDNRETLYSGCYARVSLNFYAFNSKKAKGVAVGLNAIKKTRDGSPFGSTYTEDMAISDFGDDDIL